MLVGVCWPACRRTGFSISACNARSVRRAGPTASSTFSIFAWLAALGGTIGRRHTGSSSPISAMRGLHRDRIRFDEIDLHQRQVAGAAVARAPAKSPCRQSCASCVICAGNLVRDHRDDARAAQRDQRNRDGIVAGEHDEVRRAPGGSRWPSGDVAGGFLHADDVVDLGQALQRGGLDVHAGAALHAVDDDGQRDAPRRSPCSAGTGLPAWACCSTASRRGCRRRPAASNSRASSITSCGVVAARAGQHRNFALGFFERDRDHAQMFLAGERGAFAGGAAGHQEIDALLRSAGAPAAAASSSSSD